MAGRIQTTHVGSLPRTKQITDLVFAREAGVPVEEDGFNRIVGEAIVEIVGKQKAAGIDLPSDGELSKISYATYIKDRLTGFACQHHGDIGMQAGRDCGLCAVQPPAGKAQFGLRRHRPLALAQGQCADRLAAGQSTKPHGF